MEIGTTTLGTVVIDGQNCARCEELEPEDDRFVGDDDDVLSVSDRVAISRQALAIQYEMISRTALSAAQELRFGKSENDYQTRLLKTTIRHLWLQINNMVIDIAPSNIEIDYTGKNER